MPDYLAKALKLNYISMKVTKNHWSIINGLSELAQAKNLIFVDLTLK